MNKIYKLVWSKVKNCYVAVAEIAKSHTKAPKSGVVGAISLENKISLDLNRGFVAGAFANGRTLMPVQNNEPFKITVAAIVKNEAENVPTWVQAARSCADEIVVVDTGSTDGTVERFADYGIKCFHYDWNDDFASAKNYMISLCHGDWIVLLDGDEWFRDGCDVRKAIAKHHNNPVTKAIIADWICLDKDRNNTVMFSGGAVRAFRNQPDVRYFRKVHENLTINYENFVFEPDFKMYHTGYSGSVNKSKHERNLRIMRTMFDFDNGKVEYPTDWRYVQDTYAGLGEFEKSMWASDQMLSYGVPDYSAASWVTRFNVLFAMKAPMERMEKEFEFCFRTVPSVSGFRFLASIYFARNGCMDKALDEYTEGVRMLMGPQDRVAMEHTFWRMYLPEASALIASVCMESNRIESALSALYVSEQYCGKSHWTDGVMVELRRRMAVLSKNPFDKVADKALPLLQVAKRGLVATAMASSIIVGTLGNADNAFAASCNLNGVASNCASGTNATITGGSNNTASGCYSTVSGGCCNVASSCYSYVSGGCCNIAGLYYSYVNASGITVYVSPSCSAINASGTKITVAGCEYSLTKYSGDYSSVINGKCNVAGGCYSTVISGCCNIAAGCYSIVVTGERNKAIGDYSSVSGGSGTASGKYSSVSGGGGTASGDYSSVSGGSGTASGTGSSVSGGLYSKATGYYASVGGGWGNTASASSSFVAGGSSNTAGGGGGAIIGGYCNLTSGADDSTIIGGSGNVINGQPGTCYSINAQVIVGGSDNKISDSNYSAIFGGQRNTIAEGAGYETGGLGGAVASAIFGGSGNKIPSRSSSAAIFGGSGNTASCYNSVVLGGSGNYADGTRFNSTVVGGAGNTASGGFSLAIGGNCGIAYADSSVAMGGGITGSSSCATTAKYSVAIGSGAKTTKDYEVTVGSACAPVTVGGNMTVTGTNTVTDGTNSKTWTEILTTVSPSNMRGATASEAGTAGLVPAPAAGKQNAFLRGDGTWVEATDTKYTAGTGLSLSGTTFNVKSNGAVVNGDMNLLTGDTVFTEVRPLTNGSFVRFNKSTGDNLLALDTAAKNAVKNLSVSGSTLTFTKGDNSTGTITLPDGKTYKAGTGLELASDTFSVKTDGNVASGDAGIVTGGKVYDAITRMIQYDEGTNDTATLVGSNGTKLTNLKAGTLSKTSTDAVSGAQLYATNQNIVGFASDIRRNKDNISNLNTSVTAALESVSASSQLVDVINNTKADASLNNLTAAGQQVIATAAANAVQEYMAANGLNTNNGNNVNTNSTLNASLRTVPSVRQTVDSINMSLMSVNPAPSDTNFVVYDDTSADQITLEGANGTKITNVADGSIASGSTDAVTGNQLFNITQQLDAKADITYVDNEVSAIRTVLNGKADASYVDNQLALKADASSVYTKTETDGLLSGKADISYVDDGLAKKADITYVDDGLALKADKDSVYTKLEADDLFVGKTAMKDALGKKANVDASNIDVDAWAEKLGTGEIESGNTGLVNGGAVYEAISRINDSNMIAADREAGAIRIAGNGKYDGYDVVDISKSDGTGRVMTGVITNPDDKTSAANVGYVEVVGQNIANAVNNQFDRMDSKVNRVGANAAALAALTPASFEGDEKWSLAASVGNYRDATAGAIGAFYKPTENVMMNVRGSFGNSESMVAAGVAVALNKGDIPGVTKRQLAKAVNAQAQTISAQAAEIQDMKQTYETKIANQENQIAELKAMVQQLAAKQKG